MFKTMLLTESRKKFSCKLLSYILNVDRLYASNVKTGDAKYNYYYVIQVNYNNYSFVGCEEVKEIYRLENSEGEIREWGKDEGREEKQLETVKKMLSKGFEPSEIYEITELDIKEIEKLKEEMGSIK